MSAGGVVFLLVGPSGVGKNTLIDIVLRHTGKIAQLPTATTRKQRPNEVEGREHYFVSPERFNEYIRRNDLVEWVEMHGNKYGTLRSTIEDTITAGIQRIADVDVEGARKLRALYPEHVVTLFILPPSLEVLRTRILSRGAITEDELTSRLERAVMELPYVSECQWSVVNDNKHTAAREVQRLINIERGRRTRMRRGVAVTKFSLRK